MRKFGWGLMMVLCIAMAIYAWRFLVVSPETLFPDSYEGEGTAPHFFALLKAALDEVEVPGARAQRDHPALVRGSLSPSDLDVDDGALARLEHSGPRHHERLFDGCRVTDDAERLGSHEVHAADVALAGTILDDGRMHGTYPTAGKFVR